MLIVSSKIKEMGKAVGLRTSKEFLESLSAVVADIVIQSAKKAKEAKMGTIKSRHLVVEAKE